MFRVEDLVDRSQADVLIDTAVTCNEVDIEHLIVVGSRWLGRSWCRCRVVGVRSQGSAGPPIEGIGVVCNIV